MSYQLDGRRLLIAFSLVLVLLLAGCTGQTSDQSSKEETLKVGAILPLSGPLSIYGQNIKNGMSMAEEELEEEGVDIEIIYEDSRGRPSDGISAFQKLTEVNNVDLVFAAISRVSKPLVPLAKKKKVPLVSTITAGKGVTNNSYAMRFNVQYRQNADVLFDSVITSDRYDDLAILGIQDEFGVSVMDRAEKRAEEKGIEIVQREMFAPDSSEFRTPLTKIKEENPDGILFVAVTPAQFSKFLEQKKELGIDADVLDLSFLLSVASYRKKAGENAEGAYTSALPFTLNEYGQEFKEVYRQEYGNPPFFPATYGYDLPFILKEATGGEKVSGKELVGRIISLQEVNTLNGPVEIKSNREINPPLVPARIVNGSLQRLS